MDERKD